MAHPSKKAILAIITLSLIFVLATTKNLSLTLLPLFLVTYFLLQKRSNSSNALPPGPLSVPIFGNWLQVGNDLNHRLLASLAETYGPVFLLKLGSKNLAVVSDPELASQVLHTQGVEFGSRPRNVVFDIFTGNGQDMVFTVYGDHWRKMRRIMTLPFFTNKVVHNYSNMWEEEMELVVSDLKRDEELVKSKGIVIRKRLQLMLYNIMYRMMFDAKFESMEDPLFVEATRFNSERSRLAQSFEYNYGDFIPLLRPFLRGYLNKCRDLQSRRLAFFNNYYVKKRREIMGANGEKHKISCAIDYIIDAEMKGEISEENVLYIVENINVAAIETTLWSMEWAIAEVVNHPNVQQKIRQEISQVLKGEAVTESNLLELPYLQATVKETLRLHTPIPLLVPHMNLEEAKLGGFTIPKESKVVVNAWWLANNPKWWENPEEFRPERFLEEESATQAVAGGKVDFRYLPFGMGRRSCPGIILALPILGLIIAKLVTNFEIKAPQGTHKIDGFLLLLPNSSVTITSSIFASKERSIHEPGKKQQKGCTKLVIGDKIQNPNSEIVQPNSFPPLVSALKTSAQQNVATFHFPGHNRGRAAPSSLVQLIGLKPFIHDLPELPELDNLFSPDGPILEAQSEAAKLFGASETWFLVGGTTCGIQAAILATCSPGEYLILPRNSHISAISGMVLSGAKPKYIIPEYDCHWDIAGGVTLSQVEQAIKELQMEGEKVAAVFITSPTYHGICSNLTDISKLCHSYGIPVIVDEAHGAHLGFHHKLPLSALQQGADLAVQSTHKVLCSLTQSSMLHMSGNRVDRERICRSLQTLQSTSPSYLLLASLDAARAQLSEKPETIFSNVIDLAIETKNIIRNIPGISELGTPGFSNFPLIDPLRLTFGFWQLGLSGFEADEILDKDHGVICELVGTRSITFAINLGTCRDHIQRLASGINKLSTDSWSLQNKKGKADHWGSAPFTEITMCLNPRESFFARKRKVAIGESLGSICGELICPYPPGIPVMVPGEIITKRALDYLLLVRNKGALITGVSDPFLSSIVICDI
ncbi:hypothetical protein COLO4_24913 [Corchorus olitorius]|uniref:Trans-cinnamate 4-monooxygenase n=1 Tax=Corchorus olitorius TaxID=93759 RepID=A0A1R3I5W9_9ROSI|nr:hypothetical protein COLO4_24913 [Corchorus olitorius]